MFPRATTTTPVNARVYSNTIARSTSSRVARIASPARVATPSPRRRRRRDANARARGVSESEERTRIDAMGDDASVEGANDDANDANDDANDAMDDIDAVEEMTRVLQTSLSPTAAAVVAKGFNDLGVENPRDLRALVAKRSLGMIFIELAATVFNALMAVSMFVITFSVETAPTTAFEYLVGCLSLIHI